MVGAVQRNFAYLLIALLAAGGAFWLSRVVGELGYWPDQSAGLAGRAILSVAGQAELAPQLAAYPPLPYLLLSLVELVARPLGLSSAALATALLAAGLLASYLRALRGAGYAWMAAIAFVLVFALHPLALLAVGRGAQALMLVWGVWIFGRGLFGFRTRGGVDDLLALSLSLPLLALTSTRGAVVAVSAIPFLLLAVPPDLRQRAYGSAYLVLLFPLLLAILFMIALSAILLQDPLAFITTEMLATGRWSDRPLPIILAASIAGVVGANVIGVGLILRSGRRKPLQAAAGALLGTMVLTVALLALFGQADSALHALSITFGATMVFAVSWPAEEHRTLRVGALLLLGLLVSITFIGADQRAARNPAAALFGNAAEIAPPEDLALGRWLIGREGVMIDAQMHPQVIAARGSAEGLVTETSPVFAVSLLARRIFTDHVALRQHQPSISADAISRTIPDLYRSGPPGYRLSYDLGGWRVWSRPDLQENGR
jgi:hypothetical protein